MEFSDEIRPVCLPVASSLNPNQYDFNSVTLTGWGNMFRNGKPSPTLLKALLQIFDYRSVDLSFFNFRGPLF